ncbi:glycoside hydrolase family 92 protein [Amniculicola lignicola CBS 123094]|uniref:Glycoside hydrolase family 92 protein n=1 Tax=Amniculicola lignicola CBS 123094 TaxID=1392246 RepID=A0A6A5W8A1_9PLEO|nr:glycoside hydrolase family 92 protein [Amniculicola lignicola CBS 123094]
MFLLRKRVVTILWWVGAVRAAGAQKKSGFDFVDPLIGTINGGHVFPGASLPFDVNGENQGGFASDNSDIVGFSHMHDSGTGGGASLGNFPIFPFASCPNNNISSCPFSYYERPIPRKPNTVSARPGYFAITLSSEIHAEMTVTEHAALYRFTFPKVPTLANTSLSPVIMLELDDLARSAQAENITMYERPMGRMTGQGTFSPSFGIGRYESYFCADFKGAKVKDYGIYSGAWNTKVQSLKGGKKRDKNLRPLGGWVQFNVPESQNQILVRVGMSFISEKKACQNAEKELPTFDFSATVLAAEKAWKKKLDVITIDAAGVDEGLLTTFWSGVYRTMLSPQDYTGENPLWDSKEPYYDSFYCIWDSFRSIHPLLTLLDPKSQTRMVRSLLDIYKHEGKLPDCRMSLCKGLTQGGSNADVVLVDAYFKNISEGVDWALAWEALLSDAEIEPMDWDVEGRGGLLSWKKLGYIPTDNFDPNGGTGLVTRSISRTVEYAYNDFCIAQIGRALGHKDDHLKYLKRSGNWFNMFQPNQTSSINGVDTGFRGFLQPKYMNETWGYQDPIHCSPILGQHDCYLNSGGGETYEGSSWLYTFFAPGDMASLITLLGGPERFIARLDFLHESGLLYMGDEQAFLMVFLYHYVGRPGLSAKRARSYIPSLFNETVGGIPGNDDSGAMGSFAALTLLGIFPNAGQDVYFITPPFFKSISIKNPETGKTATIRNVNFDGGRENVFVQEARLDGVKYERNWLQHRFFREGGTLELVLGKEEGKWGTGKGDGPPSEGPFGKGGELLPKSGLGGR